MMLVGPPDTRITVAGDWNFVMDTDRDVANATHKYGKGHNVGLQQCRYMMENPALNLHEFFEQFTVAVRQPADLTWAR